MQRYKELNIAIGIRIRGRREQLAYSREKLAELVGVSTRFVADVERGTVGMSLSTLKKMCEVLGLSSDFLLWGDDDKDFSAIHAQLRHIDAKYLPVLQHVVQNFVELIALKYIFAVWLKSQTVFSWA